MMEISHYDLNQLRLLEQQAVYAVHEYGSTTLEVKEALERAYELGFTAVVRGEATTKAAPTVQPKPRFLVGDLVEWTSQAGGYTRTKRGYIEDVVSPGELPDRKQFKQLYTGSGIGSVRNHVSYVVRVAKPGTAGKLYWPIASKLQPFVVLPTITSEML